MKENVMKRTKTKHSAADIASTAVIGALLMIYSISMLVPLIWGLNTSLKSPLDFQAEGNVLGLPNAALSKEYLGLKNYATILKNFQFKSQIVYYSGNTQVIHQSVDNLFTMIINTLLYAVVGALILAIVPCVVSYICAKYKFRFSKFLYLLVIFVMTMPIVGSYASEITLLRNIGIYDSIWGNWIQKFHFEGMYFLVFFAFFSGLSDAYTEAAEIDGASQLRILVSIILPLASKMIMSVALIQFVTLWNDYQTVLMYLPTHPTLAYGVYYVAYAWNKGELARTTVRVAGCMLLALPILVLFVILKDKLMGNMSMGGVKE